jgi:CIC family chloride channel protein
VRSHGVVLWSAVTGALTGLAVAGFERVVVDGLLDGLFDLPLAAIAVLPFVGLLLAWASLRFIGGGATPDTSDEYLRAFHGEPAAFGPRVAFARILASATTLGFGGALGLEGPSIYVGSSIGNGLEARLRRLLHGAEPRLLLVAGAAAGVAAIFKAPATGAIFAIEVPFQDDLGRRMLLPSLVAAATGYLAFVAVNGTDPLFPVHGTPPFSFVDLVGAAVLGAACGFGARLFAAVLRRAKAVTAAMPPWLRIVVAGALLAGLFVAGRALTGESLVLGPGYGAIAWARDPSRSVWILLAVLGLRCAATSTTVAGGGAGGLFVPLVVAGALLGGAAGALLDDHTTLFSVVGVAAFLGAGYRVPLAAVMFVAESTGRPGFVVPGLLAAVAAELVMGRSSVTRYQVRAERAP